MLLPEVDQSEADAFEEVEIFPEVDTAREEEIETFDLSGLSTPWRQASLDGVGGEAQSQELLFSRAGDPLVDQGFRFGLGIQANYDSNIRLDETDEDEDFFVALAPSFEYRSAPEGVPGLVTLRYEPFIRKYVDDDSLDSIDHSASLAVSFDGSRSQFRALVDYDRFASSNTIVQDVADSERFTLSLSGLYEVNDRNTFRAVWDYSIRDLSSDVTASTDDEVSSIELSWDWQATPNLSLGPSVRYADSDSDSFGDSESLGVTLQADYRSPLLDKWRFNGEAGIESVDNVFGSDESFIGGFGLTYLQSETWSFRGNLEYQTITELAGFDLEGASGGDARLTGRLSVIYRPEDSLWSGNLNASYRTLPSPGSAGQTADSFRINAQATRALGIARLTLGASLNQNNFSIADDDTVREDDTTTRLFVRYNRPVLQERAAFNTSVQWARNSGATDWTRVQVSSGLFFSF